MIRLFDIENGKVIPTEHCYTIKHLKDIMDNYPENYMKIYAYLFYMTCPNPDLNPYFDMAHDIKEETILRDVSCDFSLDDDMIQTSLEACILMYDTPTWRAYRGIKTMLDRMAKYMEDSQITAGRDGNFNSLISAAKNFDDIRSSFKGAYKDLAEEQSHLRGGANRAYDQR